MMQTKYNNNNTTTTTTTTQNVGEPLSLEELLLRRQTQATDNSTIRLPRIVEENTIPQDINNNTNTPITLTVVEPTNIIPQNIPVLNSPNTGTEISTVLQETQRRSQDLRAMQIPESLRPVQNNIANSNQLLDEIARNARQNAEDVGQIRNQFNENVARADAIRENIHQLVVRAESLLVQITVWINQHPVSVTLGVIGISSFIFFGFRFNWGGRIFRFITGRVAMDQFVNRLPTNVPIYPDINTQVINPNHPLSRFIPEPTIANSAAVVTIMTALRTFFRLRR